MVLKLATLPNICGRACKTGLEQQLFLLCISIQLEMSVCSRAKY